MSRKYLHAAAILMGCVCFSVTMNPAGIKALRCVEAATNAEFSAQPPFLPGNVPPLVMFATICSTRPTPTTPIWTVTAAWIRPTITISTTTDILIATSVTNIRATVSSRYGSPTAMTRFVIRQTNGAAIS
jgi:hypothetical protein